MASVSRQRPVTTFPVWPVEVLRLSSSASNDQSKQGRNENEARFEPSAGFIEPELSIPLEELALWQKLCSRKN